MADHARGRRLRLSLNRSLVLDIIHCASKVPVVPAERPLDLRRLNAVRQESTTRISWSVLFMKAHALTAGRRPVLRQCYLRWPWPHVYEHPHSTAQLIVNRRFQGEDRLCVGRFIAPERQSLCHLQRRLARYQHEPVESIYRRQVRLSRMPVFARRVIWWYNLNVSGATRSRRLGTFSISTLAGQGIANRWHPSFLTSSLAWGPLDDDGRALVTLLYDHRLMDGVEAARCLDQLEALLNGVVADELRGLSATSAVEQDGCITLRRAA